MVFDDKTPEGCAVASSATLLSIKSRSFNMRYAYNNLPKYGAQPPTSAVCCQHQA